MSYDFVGVVIRKSTNSATRTLESAVVFKQVLSELKEYAQEVDVDFVRKSVRAIGRCAIKVEASADRCVAALLDLVQLNSGDGNREVLSGRVPGEASHLLKTKFISQI